MKSLHIKMGLVCFLALFSVRLYAQTAVKLEAILDTPAINWSDAANLIFEAAEVTAPENQSAFDFAMENKWLPKDATPPGTARLNGISLLFMNSFGLKGGIFYRISKSPHHAYRELVYKKIIRGNTDPLMPVSGGELLLIMSRILSIKENEALLAVQK